MQTILNVALPIFAIMVLGYLSGYFKILGEHASKEINDFVFLIALPPAIFVFTARASLDQIFDWGFIAVYLLGIIPTVLLAWVMARFILRLPSEDVAYHSFISIFSNTGYMGIPIFITAFGPQGAIPAIVSALVAGIPAMILILSYMEFQKNRSEAGSNLRTILTGIFIRNPVFLATILGVIFAAFQIQIPGPINAMFDMLADVVGPVALFGLGLSLVGHPFFAKFDEVLWLTFAKLFIHPAAVAICAVWIVPVSPFMAIAAILLAAMPLGSTAFLMAQQYGVTERVSSATVALSTAVSIITLTALMVFFEIS